MQNQIKLIIPDCGTPKISEAFGYSTRGVPGLDIVGVGKRGRVLKEKLNYINRKIGVKIPPKRYVICLSDEYMEKVELGTFRWLELPCLLLYWSLAEVINISNLDSCLCAGILSTSGDIIPYRLNESNSNFFEKYFKEGDKLIGLCDENFVSQIIPVDQLVAPKLKIAA